MLSLSDQCDFLLRSIISYEMVITLTARLYRKKERSCHFFGSWHNINLGHFFASVSFYCAARILGFLLYILYYWFNVTVRSTYYSQFMVVNICAGAGTSNINRISFSSLALN